MRLKNLFRWALVAIFVSYFAALLACRKPDEILSGKGATTPTPSVKISAAEPYIGDATVELMTVLSNGAEPVVPLLALRINGKVFLVDQPRIGGVQGVKPRPLEAGETVSLNGMTIDEIEVSVRLKGAAQNQLTRVPANVFRGTIVVTSQTPVKPGASPGPKT